jgi:hypothetical protein
MEVVSFMTRSLYPRINSHRCPEARRLLGTQSSSGNNSEEKEFLLLLGIEPQSFSP